MNVESDLKKKSFVQTHGQKLIAAAFWAILITAYLVYTRVNGLSFGETLRQVAGLLTGPTGPIVYIVLYVLRPIIFFPATVLSLAGGAIFGPIWGIIWVAIGSNGGALLAYTIGRFFGEGLISEDESGGIVQKYAKRMRENSFETVLIMRFIFLPYDLVNYLSGILKVDWKAFLLATVFGSIPGTIAFTLAGASFGSLEQALSGEPPSFSWQTLAISISMFILGLALSRYFKSREASGEKL